MNSKSLLVILAATLAISACSSSPKAKNSESEPDKIISRVDNMNERPDYISESEPFRIQDGRVTSMGMATIPASDRVEAAYRISQNSAKAAIAGAIEQRLEFIFQNAEEGTSVGSTQARYIGAEASKLVSRSIRPWKNYWEKVATTTDSGERVTQYKVFTVVTMPEAEFKKAILDAARAAQGKGGLSKDFAEKVDAHWDQFAGVKSEDARSTASTQEPAKEE